MIKYKTVQQEVEFNDFNIIEPRLHGLIHALALFVDDEFGKDIVITGVARDWGSQGSPHFLCEENPQSRAVDIRAHFDYFTEIELGAIKMWLKAHFPRSDQEQLETSISGWSGTLRHHGSGADEHLHICVERLAQYSQALLG